MVHRIDPGTLDLKASPEAPALPQRRRATRGLAMLGALLLLLGAGPTVALAADAAAAAPYVVLVDSEKRQALLDTMASALEKTGAYKVRVLPQRSGWVDEAMDLALQNPQLVVAHFHALKDGKTSDSQAQEKLLRGMHDLQRQSPDTRFLIWSEAFDRIGAKKAQARIEAAASRAARAQQLPASAYAPLRARTQVMVLPHRLTEGGDMSAFTQAVAQAVANKP